MSWWCKNSRTPDLQKTKSVVNKMWNVKVPITDNQSWNSYRGVVSDRKSTFSSAIKPAKNNAVWPCTVCGGLLQPEHGAPAVRMRLSTLLSFAMTEAWIRWENNRRPAHDIIKTVGHQTTRTVILMGPRSWWELEQSVIGISVGLWPETNGNVHHCSYVNFFNQSIVSLMDGFKDVLTVGLTK